MVPTEILQGTVFSWVYGLFRISGDEELIYRMTLITIIYTVVVGLASIFKPIAYGKHSTDNIFTMSAKASWIIQEAPAFIVPLVLIIQTPCFKLKESNGNRVALFLFMVHYFHRSFIFPFRTINPKPVPILNCIMAFIFCFYNGLFQGMYLTNVHTIET